MPDLSIAIVTYNSEKCIEKCIGSIIGHIGGGLSYWLYVIDNNSRDRTVDLVKGFMTGKAADETADEAVDEASDKAVDKAAGEATDKITLIQNSKNIGFGAAHNQVLGMLDSRYHLVVNPDITIVNDCIAEMAAYMDKHPDIGLLSPLIKYPDGRIQYLCKRNPTFWDLFIRLAFPRSFTKRRHYFEMRETGYDKEFEIEYATGCFMLFRTETFKRINGFDENFFLYLEDADITRRVNQISKTVFYPYNYVVHEWQRGSHKSLKLALVNIKSAAYYFRKWGFRLY
ncbi:MAG: glycosyltransferase family 2 protein [Caulobacteraceae bacterium]